MSIRLSPWSRTRSRFPARTAMALALGLTIGALACPSGCSDDDDDGDTATVDAAIDSATDAAAGSDGAVAVDCANASAHIDKVVCAVDGFLATLSASEVDAATYDWSDSAARTTWSNLPVELAERNGLRFGDLGAESRAAALQVADEVLSDEGYEDFVGVLAADDYLAAQSAGGPDGDGLAYGAGDYYIAIIGTPSATGDWMLQIGGHHLAYNITYLAGVGYPTPNHIGAEPKSSFTISGGTYAPVEAEGAAMVAIFGGMASDELDASYLQGQSYDDVLVGPDNGSGALPTDYPTGSNRTGVLVSSMSSDEQALVTAAIEQWVDDYDPAIAAPLLAAYTSPSAYADTYVAWAGTANAGVDPDVSGTYMRIDGPRVWIEVTCQAGVVIEGQTHYHTIFRDKTMDYGNSL
jgi:hypothetical protein